MAQKLKYIAVGIVIALLTFFLGCSSSGTTTTTKKRLDINDPFFQMKLHYSVMKEKM